MKFRGDIFHRPDSVYAGNTRLAHTRNFILSCFIGENLSRKFNFKKVSFFQTFKIFDLSIEAIAVTIFLPPVSLFPLPLDDVRSLGSKVVSIRFFTRG